MLAPLASGAFSIVPGSLIETVVGNILQNRTLRKRLKPFFFRHTPAIIKCPTRLSSALQRPEDHLHYIFEHRLIPSVVVEFAATGHQEFRSSSVPDWRTTASRSRRAGMRREKRGANPSLNG